MSFDSEKAYNGFKHLIGFAPHFDTSEIDLDPDLSISDSGETYQEKHPALRLDYINATLSNNQTLDEYLFAKRRTAINGILNDILQYRQMSQYGKTLLEQSQLLNRHSWNADKIVNQNRFVGFQIKTMDVTGLQMIINEIGLQLDGAQSLNIYLFHSQLEDALETFTIDTVNSSVAWKKVDAKLSSMETELFQGGVFILGYYQEDLITQAINYSNFNWDAGECRTCSGSAQYVQIWKSVRNYFFVYPLYVPQASYGTKGKMFNLQKAFFDNKTSFGLNLKMSVVCDLTGFFIQNRFVFKNLLSLKMASIIMEDMTFSQETNFIQADLRNMIIRKLEGDKETNARNIPQQYQSELKAVTFNMSGINSRCLGCEGAAKDVSFSVV